MEGVRVVVDSGVARKPRFDRRTALTRLVTVPISKASSDQRAGRAGRLGPGVAYRLWSQLEHASRPAHRDAEITQVDLAGLALELAAWGAEPQQLAWLDPPPARTLAQARELLRSLDALDAENGLTAGGRAMLDLPLHPRLAHMVAVGTEAEQGALACVLATLADERDVLRGPPDQVPVDVAVRVQLVADRSARHPAADGRAVAAVRTRSEDLARRAGVASERARPARSGAGRAAPVTRLPRPHRPSSRLARPVPAARRGQGVAAGGRPAGHGRSHRGGRRRRPSHERPGPPGRPLRVKGSPAGRCTVSSLRQEFGRDAERIRAHGPGQLGGPLRVIGNSCRSVHLCAHCGRSSLAGGARRRPRPTRTRRGPGRRCPGPRR